MLICCCRSQQYTLILFRPTDANQKQNEIKNWAQEGRGHVTLQSNRQLARTSMSITAAVANAAADARRTEGAPLVQANDFSKKNESE